MPTKEQNKRYKKNQQDNENSLVEKQGKSLKNWQKILIILLLVALCVAAILVLIYLVIK